MKSTLGTLFLINLFFLGLGGNGLAASTISGAGATFPYPIYAKWAYEYEKVSGVKLNYQSIGSGGGIRQIKSKTVDFGASDAPLDADDLAASGLIQFPMIIGGVVPAVNLKAIGQKKLRLNGKILALIFLGKINKWDDKRIKALNPGIKFPSRPITVVHRSDGSGTTWIFTSYLKAVSQEWAGKVGAGKAVKWPVGIGGKGNEGVSAYVKRIDGSIGYVEYAYALQNNLKAVDLKNRAGNFVSPTDHSFQMAASGADWTNTPGMAVVLVDQPGADSWPITGASFILVHKNQKDPEMIQSVLSFFDWSYRNGAGMAGDLHYVPVPREIFELVEDLWSREIVSGGKPVWPLR